MWWSRRRRHDGSGGQAPPADARERDRLLVSRMLAGDDHAFSDFFDWHFPRLFRFAVARLGGDGQAAEDVVQATLCRAVSRLHTFRGEATLFTWLCVICRHEIADLLERSGRMVRTPLDDDNLEIRGALESLAAADTGDPERAAQRAELSRRVHAVLDALPGRYGDALEWKYLLGLSVEEIAARLGVGRKAAESVLSRARDAFRVEFAALAGGSGERRG